MKLIPVITAITLIETLFVSGAVVFVDFTKKTPQEPSPTNVVGSSISTPAPDGGVEAVEASSNTPKPTQSTGCLVKISGSVYDLTEFKKIHEGGDIFICGTDMTSTFRSQHPDSYLPKISQYKR